MNPTNTRTLTRTYKQTYTHTQCTSFYAFFHFIYVTITKRQQSRSRRLLYSIIGYT
jgi:hypothetical protein